MRSHAFLCCAAAAVAATLAAAAAGSGVRPTIGRPAPTPAQPRAGSPFTVAFHVAHATSTSFGVSLGGRAQRHSDSFHGGIARTTIAVPATAGGESLRVTVTARSQSGRATRQAAYVVHAVTAPSISIEDATAPEGNAGTTPMSFQVTLSHASPSVVSVTYATSDGSATAPSDYVAASGTLTFSPGQTSKAIVVSIVGDTVLEPDETFAVTLGQPENATILNGTATGTITNDDTAAPVSVGNWQGKTQDGEFIYFTVQPDRSLTLLRANNLSETCSDPNVETLGALDFGPAVIPIAADGTFLIQGSSDVPETNGDLTVNSWTWKVTGTFTSATAMNGTLVFTENDTYKGNPMTCAANLTYSAALVG